MKAPALLVLGLFAAALAACQLLAGIETRDQAQAPADAMTDGGGDGDAPDAAAPVEATTDADTCEHAAPPPPPDANSPTGQSSDFYAALYGDLTFTDTPDSGTILGYDLDHTCTCPGPESCVPPANMPHCDGPAGRDTAGNAQLDSFQLYLSATPQGTLNERIMSGLLTLIVIVRNYNGGADDTQVALSALVSSGIIADPDAGTTTAPKWDGTDVWNIDPRTALEAKQQPDGGWTYQPEFVATDAYVTGHLLVAHLAKMVLGVGVGTLTMNDVYITATINPDFGGYRLDDGQVAARVPLDSLFTIVSTFLDPFNHSQHLCGTDPTFTSYKPQACAAADIASTPALDHTGAPCDAISIAVGFTARKANLGSPFMNIYPNPGCDGGVATCP